MKLFVFVEEIPSWKLKMTEPIRSCIILTTLIVLMSVASFENGSFVNCPTKCNCSRTRQYANCLNLPLENFPNLPTFVRKLTIDNSTKGNLTVQNLRNLSNNGMKILKLKLVNTNISFIEPDALGMMAFLVELEIDGAFLDQRVLSNALVSLQKTNIDSITFENIGNWHNLDVGIFDGLVNTMIQQIKISRMSNLQSLNCGVFTHLNHLQRLDVSKNALGSIQLTGLSQLKYLDISSNDLTTRINFCNYNLTSLERLFCGNNFILEFKYPLNCLPKLRLLDMSNNIFRQIENNVIADLPKLEELILTRVDTFLERVHPYAFNSSSLKTLYFEGKGRNFEVTPYSFPANIFNSCVHLSKLSLSQLNMGKVTATYIQELLTPLHKLQELRFEGNGLNLLPYRMLSMFPNITHLSLYDNNEEAWKNSEIFHNVNSLAHLNLGHSYISEINQNTFPSKILNTLTAFDLRSNPFACTCEFLWFSEWLKVNTWRMVKFNEKSNYTCHSPDKLQNVHLLNFTITENECSPLLLGTIISVSFAVVFLVLFGCSYRYRWYIKYWFYILRSNKLDPKQRNPECIYDAFVIYCDEDSEWVHSNLIHKLEKENRYKLCIHFRDFVVGRFIIDNIVDSMYKSRKIILVLSETFTKSEWCLLELRLAQKRWLLEGSGILVVIIVGSLSGKSVRNSILRTMLHTTTYAQWSSMTPCKVTIFWNQIIKTLSENNADESEIFANNVSEETPLLN